MIMVYVAGVSLVYLEAVMIGPFVLMAALLIGSVAHFRGTRSKSQERSIASLLLVALAATILHVRGCHGLLAQR
jgi:hypothetical protein